MDERTREEIQERNCKQSVPKKAKAEAEGKIFDLTTDFEYNHEADEINIALGITEEQFEEIRKRATNAFNKHGAKEQSLSKTIEYFLKQPKKDQGVLLLGLLLTINSHNRDDLMSMLMQRR